MASLPVNSTARWFFDYANAIATHTLMIRGTTGATDALIEDDLATLLGDIGGGFSTSTITGARKAAAGSDFAFPYASGAVGDSFGGLGATAENNAVGLTFVGRSPDGRRARFTLFGWAAPLSAYRLTTAEDGNILAAVNHLNAFGTSFASIGGLTAIWNGYADLKSNDHWVKEARG